MQKLNITVSPVRPLPYFNTEQELNEKRLASNLRQEFVPKIKRLLPGHHLTGFKHDTVINFIRRNKMVFPCFVRTDITQFYPSIRHQDIVVGCQIAYRDLLGMEYVPKNFKSKYVFAVNMWCRSLPLPKGIPLGSPMSAILAPVMLIPLWLKIKRRYHLPILVFMDDILVCTHDEGQSAEIYALIARYLYDNYALELNMKKTVSGRFATNPVTFCGWRFAGGYATISEQKVEAFRQRVHEFRQNWKGRDAIPFIKLLNRKIDAFGHYYKYGDVKSQFRKMDMFIRQEVRHWYEHTGGRTPYSRQQLKNCGLHELENLIKETRTKKKELTSLKHIYGNNYRTTSQHDERETDDLSILVQEMEKMNTQLTQLVALQRKQLRLLNILMDNV